MCAPPPLPPPSPCRRWSGRPFGRSPPSPQLSVGWFVASAGPAPALGGQRLSGSSALWRCASRPHGCSLACSGGDGGGGVGEGRAPAGEGAGRGGAPANRTGPILGIGGLGTGSGGGERGEPEREAHCPVLPRNLWREGSGSDLLEPRGVSCWI